MQTTETLTRESERAQHLETVAGMADLQAALQEEHDRQLAAEAEHQQAIKAFEEARVTSLRKQQAIQKELSKAGPSVKWLLSNSELTPRRQELIDEVNAAKRRMKAANDKLAEVERCARELARRRSISYDESLERYETTYLPIHEEYKADQRLIERVQAELQRVEQAIKTGADG